MPTRWCALLGIVGVAIAQPPVVLVTGAAGRTGSLLYARLKQDQRIASVRALVRNVTKARAVLHCTKCDETEGIYVGDVTNPDTMKDAMTGVDTLAIAAAVGGTASAKLMRAVEFDGVENQVSVLAGQNQNRSALRVVLCSSMGTTNPNPPPFEGGKVLFWKLNAEAFLMSSGIGATIVKPCGLTDGPAGKTALDTLHDDKNPSPLSFTVSRADVAAVMAEAAVERAGGLRFGLCSKALGAPTTDLAALLHSARWPWQRA